MQPLTHHQIIDLVEPFTRRGRHVDLSASNRLERCLVFKSVENHAGNVAASTVAGPRDTLKLENPSEGYFRLTRSLQLASGLQAGLVAEGTDAGDLLQRVEAVAPQRVFRAGPGYATGLSFRLEAPAGAASSAAAPRMILTGAVAQVRGFTLTLRPSPTRGIAADIELAAPAESTVELPEDLLAVIGWDWAPLLARNAVWTSKLRVRGREPGRSTAAESKLDRTLRHLAAVLAQPPAAFHDRHVVARWGAAFRRLIPWLTVIAMFTGVGIFSMQPRDENAEMSGLLVLMFHVPTVLLALAFTLQESPRFEIPPWPRRLKASAWPVAEQAPAHESR